MRPTELNKLLIPHVETICRQLLPQGEKKGAEWLVGDVSGKPGQSMKIRLAGPKAGRWSDFDADIKGDLIGLYKAVQNCGVNDAKAWAQDFLGIRCDKFDVHPKAPEPKTIDPPKGGDVGTAAEKWFKKRGISKAVLDAFKITNNGVMINFPYYAEDKVYHIKYLNMTKPKKERWSCSKGSTPILFGWQAIPEDAREVVITEGEFDALAYAQHSIPALSLPMGSGGGYKLKWIELDWERLEQFDTIYLSFDMDTAGQETIGPVLERLGHHRCKIISLPVKDANDTLLAGHDLDEFIQKAKYVDPPQLRAAETFSDELKNYFAGDQDTQGDALPWPKSDAQFRLRPGELTIWHGFSGHGKSMVLSMIASYLISQGSKLAIASMEIPAVKLLARMYQQYGAIECPSELYIDQITEAFIDQCWIVNIQGTAKAELVLEMMDYSYHRYGVQHGIIDSLSKCGFAEDDYNGQKEFVDKLTDFCRDKAIHLHLVNHDRKGINESSTPGKMDVKGTGGITDMADNVVAVWRNKPKEEGAGGSEDQGDAYLQVQKQRYYDWEGKLSLWYHQDCHQYLDNDHQKPRTMLENKPPTHEEDWLNEEGEEI